MSAPHVGDSWRESLTPVRRLHHKRSMTTHARPTASGGDRSRSRCAISVRHNRSCQKSVRSALYGTAAPHPVAPRLSMSEVGCTNDRSPLHRAAGAFSWGSLGETPLKYPSTATDVNLCQAQNMETAVRDYQEHDEQPIVEFSLRAWAPIFEAVGEILGPKLLAQLRDDWRTDQAKAVREALAAPAHRVGVAERPEGKPAGFVVARVDRDSGVGEIYMIAVDPDAQGHGVGAALTQAATDWLQQSGMQVAMIETSGDPGHAPARHTYEKAGYTALPAVRFFKSL